MGRIRTERFVLQIEAFPRGTIMARYVAIGKGCFSQLQPASYFLHSSISHFNETHMTRLREYYR